eukprot:1193955-Prorocentrum_minimum.AAC.1
MGGLVLRPIRTCPPARPPRCQISEIWSHSYTITVNYREYTGTRTSSPLLEQPLEAREQPREPLLDAHEGLFGGGVVRIAILQRPDQHPPLRLELRHVPVRAPHLRIHHRNGRFVVAGGEFPTAGVDLSSQEANSPPQRSIHRRRRRIHRRNGRFVVAGGEFPTAGVDLSSQEANSPPQRSIRRRRRRIHRRNGRFVVAGGEFTVATVDSSSQEANSPPRG